MAIGSGLGSSAGWSAESTYGTYVAPAKFARHRSATVNKTATRPQGEGIQAGTYAMLGSQLVEAVTGGTGQVQLDVQSKGLGVLLNTLMGGTVTPTQQAATAAYLATFPLADTYGKSMTFQVGLPQRGGTVTPATLKGTKVTQAAFSCSVDGILQGTFDLDAQAYENTTSLASVSYSSGVNVFHGGQMTVKMGTYGSEAAVSGVKAVSLTIARPHDDSAYYAGASAAGTKSEPVLNGVATISGSIDVDFINTVDFHARARDLTSTSLVLEWVGPLIASTYYETFRITVPMVYFMDPSSYSVGGREVLSNSFGFEARYDGTNSPVTIATISTDTAL